MPTPPNHHAAPPGFRNDLVRWQQLVSAPWLAALLASRTVAAAPTGAWRLLEVGCDDIDAFVGGHIPGASYMDTAELEQEPLWNKVPGRHPASQAIATTAQRRIGEHPHLERIHG